MKKIVAMIMIIAAVLGLAACGGDKQEEPYEEIPAMNVAEANTRQTVLYLEDDFGYIVPVMKEIEWVEGIGTAAVEALKADPNADTGMAFLGLNPILTEDAEVSLNIKEGIATLQLSQGAIAADDAATEMNKVVAVVNTLAEFPAVDSVKIEQAGAEGTLPSGTDVSAAFSPFDINVMSAVETAELETASKIMLYYENAAGTAIVPVTKYIGGAGDAFAAMNELVRGPEKDGLKNLFPIGSELLGVDVGEEGVATVNFSGAFANVTENERQEKMLQKCIMLTLTQFDNIDSVRILIDGEEYADTAAQTMAIPEFVNSLN